MGISRKGCLLAFTQNSQNMNTFLHNFMNFGKMYGRKSEGFEECKLTAHRVSKISSRF